MTDDPSRTLRAAIVLRVAEGVCELVSADRPAGFAAPFPTPHVERVSPGHLVALAERSDGGEVVVWRWYDAVVLGTADGLVRLWEPAHGEVVARPRTVPHRYQPGTRAYLSAGLPGADWWVAGPVPSDAAPDAGVLLELDEVAKVYSEQGLWARL